MTLLKWLILALLVSLQGCGYMICRGFGNTTEQCTSDCTFECERNPDGSTVADPYGRYPGDCKVIKTCTVGLRKVLVP